MKAIYGYESSKNEIFDCNICGGEAGIFFEKCPDNSIYNCSIFDNDYGIDLDESNNNIVGCNISGGGLGTDYEILLKKLLGILHPWG